MRDRRKFRPSLALASVATVLGACSMLDSSALEMTAAPTADGSSRCVSRTGSYQLSKTFFHIEIDKAGDDYEFKRLDLRHRPDRTRSYCLDYAASATSHDIVKVFKVKAGRLQKVIDEKDPTKKTLDAKSDLAASGSDLLHAITTEAKDESAFILKTLTRALFIGLSGNPGFTPSGVASARTLNAIAGKAPTRVLDVEYDPFNLAQSAISNQAMSHYGYCVLVQGVSIPLLMGQGHAPRSVKDNAYPAETINTYCDEPEAATQRNFEFAQALLKAEAAPFVRATRGIMYRPRIPFTVHVFKKENRRVRGGWRLLATEVAELENISPTVAVGVDRAFFAQRKTTILFDQGVVTNVCVFKTSELAAFVTVPLEIAQSIVALPAQIIQVRIDNNTSEQRFLQAQNNLLKSEINRWKLEQDVNKLTVDYNAKKQIAEAPERNRVPDNITKAMIGQLLADQLANADATKAVLAGTIEGLPAICSDHTTKTAGQ